MFFFKSDPNKKPYFRRIASKRNGFIFLFIALAFIFLNIYRLNDPLPVGYKIDDFKLQNISGIEFNITDINIPTVLVFYKKHQFFSNFMFNHFYQKQLPQLKFLQDNNLAYVVVITEGYDTLEKLNELTQDPKHQVLKTVGYITDNKNLGAYFGVRSYPHLFVLNSDHIIIYEAKLATADYIKKILWR